MALVENRASTVTTPQAGELIFVGYCWLFTVRIALSASLLSLVWWHMMMVVAGEQARKVVKAPSELVYSRH